MSKPTWWNAYGRSMTSAFFTETGADSSLFELVSLGPIAAISGVSVGQLWVLGRTRRVLAVFCPF
jgi:hypothetical protein